MPVRKWLGLVCLAIILLLIAALGALHTPPGRNFVRSRVASLLASRQINFDVDQLRYNLFDLSLDLRDVTIKSAGRESDPPFAFITVVESGLIEGARVQYLTPAD